MTKLSLRKFVQISIEDKETDLLLAEQLVMTFPAQKKGTIKQRDLGSLCYRKRSPFSIGISNKIPRMVDIDSLDTTRREGMSRYFDFLRNQWILKKSSSLIDNASINACRYADFCDGLMNSEEAPIFNKSSLVSYIRWLIHRTSLPRGSKNYLALSTARKYQNDAIIFLTASMKASKSELVSGIKLISNVPRQRNTTSQPDEEDLAFTMKTHYSLFIGLKSLILDYKKLPYAIEMTDQTLYCLADSTCYFTSNEARRERKTKNITFDYENGRYFSEAEVTAGIKKNTSAWHGRISCLKRAFESTESANLTQRSKVRIMFANIACQAFYMMSIANTGANDQVARDILWNKDSSISGSGNSWQGLVIKNRGATEIQVEIGSKFKRIFDLYIKLREWLVNGREADYLFMYERRDGILEQYNADSSSLYKLKLKKTILK